MAMGSCNLGAGSGIAKGKGAEDSGSVDLHQRGKAMLSVGLEMTDPELSGSSSKNSADNIADTKSNLDGQIISRCSLRAVHEIISGFDEKKREIVEAIGFGGLLKFPRIRSTNRRFSVWLMSMVDAGNSSLNLPDGRTLKFYSEDVYIAFGIPGKGKKVSDARMINRELREKLKLQCWPNDGKEKQSIKAVEEVRCCTRMLQTVVKDADATLKGAVDYKVEMGTKIDRIGERLVFICLANLVVALLVLMVLLFK